MECCLGAFNTSGFSSQLQSISSGTGNFQDLKWLLPSTDHLTYAGMFNEIQFQIGQKTQKPLDLHLSFGRATNPSSVSDKRINQFLAIFLKGGKDGEPRDHRILNAVIVLDISGSMGGTLSNSSSSSRLSLAKQAVKMFISKLKPTDSFGIVTFNNDAHIVVKGIRKSEINLNNVFAMVDNINVYGGTTLSSGFQKGLEVLNSILQNTKSKDDCENRIIMITDVCDNSLSTTNNFISQVGQKQIHTTIIGVSDDFESSICQKLTTIKGFNYFCAVNTDDLKKYLYQNFDWTFFPSSYNIQIKIKSQNIQLFEVFGSPDSDMVNKYNDFATNNKEYIITKIPSSFPSQLIIENGIVKTVGGLILLKLSPQNNLTQFKGEIELTYTTYNGINMSQTYPLQYNFPKNEQFYSEPCISEGINGFYFVNQMKHLIQSIKSDERKEEELRNAYKASFEKLKEFAPKSKTQDIDALLKIFNKE